MGDGIALVAWTLAGKPWSSGDARTANLVADWFIAKGHCDHLVPPSRSVTHQQLTAAPEPVVPRPPASEVELLWHRCTRVDADPEVRTWLAEVRGFDPQVIADRDLARALPCTGDVPPWATFCGRSWRDTGHRVILPAYEPDPLHPGTLRLASLRARCIRPCEPGDKVGAPAAGQGSATGLVLSMHPGEPLRDGVERQLVTIAEGEPDFIALSLRPASVRGALLGAWSGSAQAAVGALIPAGWTAALLHHADEGGAQQAQVWRKLLEPRGVRCVRLRPPIV